MSPELKTDYLIKGITKCGSFRVIAVSTKLLTQEARDRHNLSNTCTVALGRTIACGFLLCNTLMKDKGHLMMKIRGNGPIGKIIIDASTEGTVRGYVEKPEIECFDNRGFVSVSDAVGIGLIEIAYNVKGDLPYTGVAELVTSEIADDVVNYLAKSEQIYSYVSCGVYIDPENGQVKHAGGYIVQRMPNAKEEDLIGLEETLSKMDPFSILMRSNLSLNEIINKALTGYEVEMISEFEGLCFYCSCTEETFKKALKTLTKEEIESIIKEKGHIEGKCQFCSKVYKIKSVE